MSSFSRYFLFVILATVVAVFLYVAVIHIPSRSVEFATSVVADGTGVFTTLLKNLFASKDVSVVVFGKPGGLHQGAELADAIVVVHFSPRRNQVTLISIPRDLWISDNQRQFKINEALRLGVIPSVIQTIERITGLSITGYAVVDLSLVERVIDDLGGVTLTLSAPAIDWVSGYTMKAGVNHLNGEDAVWLMRNRFNPEGDFFREKNQHAIIQSALLAFLNLDRDAQIALVRKHVMDGNLLSQSRIDAATVFSYLFETDFSSLSVRSVVLDFSTKLLKTSTVPFIGIGTTTYVSVLLPTEGFERYGAIRAYILEKLEQQ